MTNHERACRAIAGIVYARTAEDQRARLAAAKPQFFRLYKTPAVVLEVVRKVHHKHKFVDAYSFIEGLKDAGLYQNPDRLPREEFALMNDATMDVDGYFNEMLAGLEEQWKQSEGERLTRRMTDGEIDFSKFAAAVQALNGRTGSSIDEPITTPQWPSPLNEDAYPEPIRSIIRTIEPQTEADPVALLLQLLAVVGSVIARTAHAFADGARHYLNLYVTLVGTSAKSRKGTSWSHIRAIANELDYDWLKNRVKSGLSSGEGLVYHLRDANPVNDDRGVTDKRLLVQESEFASILRVLSREGNTLSPKLRDAWDGRDLETMTRSGNGGLRASAPHLTVVAHITRDELRRNLTTTEIANGLGNRFLWACVRRSNRLPFGGEILSYRPMAESLRPAIEAAGALKRLSFDAEAAKLWIRHYDELSEGLPGLLGSITARAEAQVLRLGAIYAVACHSPEIRVIHLKAALEVWRYCFESARFIFGDATGDPLADEILNQLEESRDLNASLSPPGPRFVPTAANHVIGRSGLCRWNRPRGKKFRRGGQTKSLDLISDHRGRQ